MVYRNVQLTQNILAPTDFSRSSRLALEAAAILASQNDARVTLVHVHTATRLPFQTVESIPQETETKIHSELRRWADELFASINEVKTALVISDNAADGIVNYAAKEDVDMIVMSTHGRTGLAKMLIGGVAEQVVRHAKCPVLTLRSKL